MNGSERPILLKKSAAISEGEKYVSEIEILNLRRALASLRCSAFEVGAQ